MTGTQERSNSIIVDPCLDDQLCVTIRLNVRLVNWNVVSKPCGHCHDGALTMKQFINNDFQREEREGKESVLLRVYGREY